MGRVHAMKALSIAACLLIAIVCALGFFACAFAADRPNADAEKEEALARGFAGGAIMALVALAAIIAR
jgi:hypothetical protein